MAWAGCTATRRIANEPCKLASVSDEFQPSPIKSTSFDSECASFSSAAKAEPSRHRSAAHVPMEGAMTTAIGVVMTEHIVAGSLRISG